MIEIKNSEPKDWRVIQELNNEVFISTWNDFMKLYPKVIKSSQDNAENLMIWGNILTHGAKFIEE